jgi:hypothetical protein
VSALITSFDAHGPVSEVSRHLRRVSVWLGSPDLRDLDRERGVLRAESELRGGPLHHALGMRYGATGPGLASYDEPGLVRATTDALDARCRRVLTKGNAVLVLDGPPPVNLRLGLADGSYLPPPPARSTLAEFPRVYQEPAGLVLSGVVDRSPEATIAAEVLREAVEQEVRTRAGAAYAPWATYERVDVEHAVLAAGSDLMPQLVPRILHTAVDVVDRLVSGVSQAKVDGHVRARLQSLQDPYNAVGIAVRAAQAVFDDKVPPTFEQLQTEVEQTDPEKVRAAFGQLRTTLLLGAPGGAKLPRHATTLGFPATEGWPGTRGHRHRDWPRRRGRFHAGPQGFQITAPDGTATAVSMDDLAAVIASDDGTRHLVRRDGWTLIMAPDAWRGGAALVRAIDELTPAHLRLPRAGAGSLPFRPVSARDRWLPSVGRVVSSAPALLLLTVLSLVVTVGLFRGDIPAVAIGFALITFAFARLSLRAVLRR